jgi:holliday junction DNA helicase RuvB
VGQQHAKEVLKIWTDRSLIDDTPLPHVLFTGPPGMGKTLFTQAIAGELGEDSILDIDLSRVNPKIMFQTLLKFPGGIVNLDEVHKASKAQQDLLLQAMDEKPYLATSWGEKYELSDLTFISATTHAEKLEPAFTGRHQIQIEMDAYTPDEMAIICQQVAIKLGGELSDDQATTLGQATLGIPRTARDLTRAWWAIRPDGTVAHALALSGVEEDGLSNQHLRYLRVMRDLGGQLGERPLANVLRLHPTILGEVERGLMAKGYLRLTPGGRMLTASAYRRLERREDG